MGSPFFFSSYEPVTLGVFGKLRKKSSKLEQRSKTDYYYLTKTMNVTKTYGAFVSPGYSLSVLTKVTLNLCKKGTVLTQTHTSLWLKMQRCTGHSYLKNTTFTVQNLFSLKLIFLYPYWVNNTYKKWGSPFSFHWQHSSKFGFKWSFTRRNWGAPS